MKHTLEELQFAEQVRDLVYKRAVGLAPEELDKKEFVRWRNEHLRVLTEQALKELDTMADLIKTIRAEQQQKGAPAATE